MTSLGHASYLGVAAYISALLTSRYGFGHGAAAFISISGTVAMAAFFGVIALRATGLGFLMITLALSQVLWGLAYRMSNVTNGDNGITGLTRPSPFGISLDQSGRVLLVCPDRGDSRFPDDGDLRLLRVRLFVEGSARSTAPNGRARLQSLAGPLDHFCIRRLLGCDIRPAVRLLSQVHPSRPHSRPRVRPKPCLELLREEQAPWAAPPLVPHWYCF